MLKNLFQAELFRFRTQRSTFVIPLVVAVFSFLMSYYIGIVYGTSPFVAQIFDHAREVYHEMGMDSLWSQFEETRNMLTFESVMQFAATTVGQLPVLALVFFNLFFIGRPHYNGAIRSIVNSGNRKYIVIVDAFFLLIFSVVSVLLNGLLVLPGAFMMFQGSPVGSVPMYFLYLLLMILLVFSAGLIMLMFVAISRRPFLGVFFGFFYATVFSEFLYDMIDIAGEKLFHVSFEVERFTVFGAISTLHYDRPMSMLYALIAAIVFGIIAFIVANLIFKKKDV